jgi:hypothetical protein
LKKQKQCSDTFCAFWIGWPYFTKLCSESHKNFQPVTASQLFSHSSIKQYIIIHAPFSVINLQDVIYLLANYVEVTKEINNNLQTLTDAGNCVTILMAVFSTKKV